MTDDPIAEAVRQIPKNELRLEGGASQRGGARLGGTLEREKGDTAGGVSASVEQRGGWSVFGFLRKAWK